MKTAPSPENCLLGAGEVFFDRFDTNGNRTGLRHFGNVEKLEVTPSVETLEKKSSMDGARGTYKKVTTNTSAEVALTLSEYDPHNVALALLGSAATYSQTLAATLTSQPINGGAAIALGRWYFLGKKAVTVTTVKQGATTLVAGVDYTVKTDVGLIYFPETGAATAAITTWDGSCAAITNKMQIQMLDSPTIEGYLYYYPALNQAAGPRYEGEWWKVSIAPDGALALLSEEFATIGLKGTVMMDPTKPVGQRYGAVREL